MVDDLFELAQVDAAEFARDARSVPLAEAVQGALDLCRPEAAEKRIRLDVDLGDAGPEPVLTEARAGGALAARQRRALHAGRAAAWPWAPASTPTGST